MLYEHTHVRTHHAECRCCFLHNRTNKQQHAHPPTLAKRALASSMSVMSWKCLVLGMPRQRMPYEWRDSWKWRSKALRPQYDSLPQISHLNSSPSPCSLYSQKGIGLPSQPSGRFRGLYLHVHVVVVVVVVV